MPRAPFFVCCITCYCSFEDKCEPLEDQIKTNGFSGLMVVRGGKQGNKPRLEILENFTPEGKDKVETRTRTVSPKWCQRELVRYLLAMYVATTGEAVELLLTLVPGMSPPHTNVSALFKQFLQVLCATPPTLLCAAA